MEKAKGETWPIIEMSVPPVRYWKDCSAVTYVAVHDEVKSRLYVSPQIEAISGFSSAEWLADPELWVRQLHPDDRERVLAEVCSIQDNDGCFCSEYRMLARDGRVVWLRDEATVVRDEVGQPCFIQGFMLDISEFLQAAEAFKRSEAKFRAIFERTAVGIALVDIEGRLIESNPGLEEMLGYSREELLHRAFVELAHPDDAMADVDLYRDLVGGVRDHYQVEKRYIGKNGSILWGRLNVSLVRSAEGEPQFTIHMVEDITGRKRLENQFLQSQKMETIGRLAGGIAHDFNNVLTIIHGYTELSLPIIPKGDPLRENIEGIKIAVERAADLTRQLLAFSRRQVMEMKVFDLNTLLRGLDKMLRRVIGEDIEMVTVFNNPLGKVKADPAQIEHVILNLAVNARDAMPSGGKLTLETANVKLSETYAHNHDSVIPGRYVMLSVKDTGFGMSQEVKEKIFEPFFTTKEKGKGTGLGLSTVYGIVKQSGGNIWVYSEPGQGTIFKIILPQVDEEIDTQPSRDELGDLPQGTEMVLLVEDDPSVRNLAARILRKQGYKVLEAGNGDEAMHMAREHMNKKMHLLLTDVVMPHMGGKELVEQFRVLHPDAKVLFISGYTNGDITNQALNKPMTPFLQKPFSPMDLVKKVRKVLDG